MLRTLTLLAGLVAAPMAGADATVLPASAESRRLVVVVDRGVTHTNQLPWSLRTLRKRMVGGTALPEADLRKLADRKDSLAALKMVKILRLKGVAADPSDMAFYAAIAAGAGRKGMLGDMIDALHRLDPATEPKLRTSQYIRVLYGYAWAGNTRAQDAMIALNGSGKLFGPMSGTTRNRIVSDGSGRMVLSLALKDMARADLDVTGMNRVITYLEVAATRGDLAIRTMAQSLMPGAKARRDTLAENG